MNISLYVNTLTYLLKLLNE